jgi:hypothetical protein
MDGIGRDVTKGTIPAFLWRDCGKPQYISGQRLNPGSAEYKGVLTTRSNIRVLHGKSLFRSMNTWSQHDITHKVESNVLDQ